MATASIPSDLLLQKHGVNRTVLQFRDGCGCTVRTNDDVAVFSKDLAELPKMGRSSTHNKTRAEEYCWLGRPNWQPSSCVDLLSTISIEDESENLMASANDEGLDSASREVPHHHLGRSSGCFEINGATDR